MIWMGLWWVGEVLPPYVTSLLPLILAPLFGIMIPQEISLNYARPTIFLFLGSFILARALEKYNIHLYLTQRLVRIFGSSEIGIFLGVLSIGSSGILRALALSSAYSSSIGGMATLVGTPPNIVYAGILRQFGENVNFLDWLKFGLLYSISLELAFLALAIWSFGISSKSFNLPVSEVSLSKEGKIVLFIFVITILLWIILPFINDLLNLKLEDSTVAITSAVFLFALGLLNSFKLGGC